MQIYERINTILKSKNLKKKEFVKRFIELEPKLKSTGEAPSIPSIYNYLNGNREIKAELIPYMAKALEVSEQELFIDDINITNFFKDMIHKIGSNEKEYTKLQSISRIIDLCQYASEPLLLRLIETLEKNKENTLRQMKDISLM
ncbi:hypothetical protein U5B43_07435 [Campylobacter sp. 9BO]|uniref:hypothetical protein n=1 Tax=Campylobacter sp. 9BO TaxID=3424759 RepID=UPI003D347D01